MRNSRDDVVSAALRVLNEHGLEACSMRRVAAELDVQPSALYHHVPNKQSLLALMADRIVRGVGRGSSSESGADVPGSTDDVDPRALCIELRDAMLAVRDGADVVATAEAFRLGSSAIERRLAELVGADGARTLLFYTFGHAQSTQTHRQAAAFGALLAASEGAGSASTDDSADPAGAAGDVDLDGSYARGLDIILRGLGGATELA